MSIEQRLERLERQNRWLKGGLASLVVVLAAGVLFGFASQQEIPDLIKARQFQVVSEDGLVLVKLEGTLGRVGLRGTVETLNGKGQELVRLLATKDGGGAVWTLNAEGQSLVLLGADPDGRGAVAVFDPSHELATGTLAPR